MIRLSKSIVGHAEIAAASAVLERGFLGMGAEVRCFEEELSTYLGGQQVACVNTGTSALHLALEAVGIGLGDEVLVPTLTYVASFQAIAAVGATPVACDVRVIDGLLDLEDAERRVTLKTRAIMPVHYASFVGNLNAVYAFAKKYKLRVVEDAAHAFGCTYGSHRIGSFGDVVCFSFDGIKNITSGEGGAIASSDPHVMAHVRDARLLGVEKDSEKRFRGERSWDFEVAAQGWRYHMSDIMAAIGRVQLNRFESEFKPRRRQLHAHYRRLLDDINGLCLFSSDSESVVPHIFPIRILGGRRNFIRKALDEAGIQTGIHYKPNHLLEYFGSGKISLPVSEMLYEELLTLPLHPGISDEECIYVASMLIDLLGSN
jgi:dTDP-4-amino-4,6-dideoxygalactose transaminase